MEIHSWCCAWLCKFTPTWCWPRVFTRLQRVLVNIVWGNNIWYFFHQTQLPQSVGSTLDCWPPDCEMEPHLVPCPCVGSMFYSFIHSFIHSSSLTTLDVIVYKPIFHLIFFFFVSELQLDLKNETSHNVKWVISSCAPAYIRVGVFFFIVFVYILFKAFHPKASEVLQGWF